MSLTDLVIRYKLGFEKWDTVWPPVEFAVDKLLHRIPVRDHEAFEYRDSFLKTIFRVVGNFNFKGAKVETYLYSCMKFHYKSWVREQCGKKKIRDQLLLDEAKSSADLVEEQALFCSEEYGEEYQSREISKLKCNEKRLLMVALKNCEHLTDSCATEISARLGISRAWLLETRDLLRDEVADARFRSRVYQERAVLMRMKILANEDPSKEASLRHRLVSLEKRARQTWRFPSHSAIAQSLGIPKGSVDSGMYQMRKKLEGGGVLELPERAVYARSHEDPPRKQQRPQAPRIPKDTE